MDQQVERVAVSDNEKEFAQALAAAAASLERLDTDVNPSLRAFVFGVILGVLGTLAVGWVF